MELKYIPKENKLKYSKSIRKMWSVLEINELPVYRYTTTRTFLYSLSYSMFIRLLLCITTLSTHQTYEISIFNCPILHIRKLRLRWLTHGQILSKKKSQNLKIDFLTSIARLFLLQHLTSIILLAFFSILIESDVTFYVFESSSQMRQKILKARF